VSGSKIPAATGALIFLCAGAEDLFNEVKANGFRVMGKGSHFLSSKVGFGTRAKLVINSLMGTMLAAFSESLALSESVGLDPNKMIDIIGQSSMQSPLYAMKGPKMVVHDYDPNFALKHAVKDMTLASNLANNAGVEFSVIHQAEELFRVAGEDAELAVADEDFSAIYEKVRKDSKKK
jgi:3-hydroxyisobutyrate dehydrogenase-like beta-hydroxyacid dehydrogenase